MAEVKGVIKASFQSKKEKERIDQEQKIEEAQKSRLTVWKKPHPLDAYYGPDPTTGAQTQTSKPGNEPSSKDMSNAAEQDIRPDQHTKDRVSSELTDDTEATTVQPTQTGFSVPNYRPGPDMHHSDIVGATNASSTHHGQRSHPGPTLEAIKEGKAPQTLNPHLQILCGPLLRYDTVMDGLWRGAVLIVTNDVESIYSPVPKCTVEWESEVPAAFEVDETLPEPEGEDDVYDPNEDTTTQDTTAGVNNYERGSMEKGRGILERNQSDIPPTPPPKDHWLQSPTSATSTDTQGAGGSAFVEGEYSDSGSEDDEEPLSPLSPTSPTVASPGRPDTTPLDEGNTTKKSRRATWASSMKKRLASLKFQPGGDFRGRPPERIAQSEQKKKERQDSATKRIIEGEPIYKYHGVATTATFWRFLLEVPMNPDPAKGMRVHYAINKPKSSTNTSATDSLGPTDIVFHIPPTGSDIRFAAFSCNGFSEGIDQGQFMSGDFKSGFEPVWSDLLERHEKRPFHALVGGGDQIYCDSIMKEPELQEYVKLTKKEDKIQYPLTDAIAFAMDRFYFNHYCLIFRSGAFGRAISQIPMVNMLDDHDLIDGFGSYPEELQRSAFFKHIGSRGYFWFLLFQLFTVDTVDGTLVEPGQHTYKSMVIGNDGAWIPFPSHSSLHWFGEHTWLLMLDCRAERKHEMILSPDTYQRIFSILNELPDQVEHLIVQVGIPIAYPRMNLTEKILDSDGIVAKLARSGISSKLTNKYNQDIELLDDLSDHWTARHHKRERNWFIRQLQEVALKKGVRVSFVSGDVHLASIGLFKTYTGKMKQKEVEPSLDHRWMLNIVSSAIVNTPPPPGLQLMVNSLASHKHRTMHREHTDEVMLPLFQEGLRTNKRRLNYIAGARNYAIGERDPETGELVFNIRVERRKGHGETKGYVVRASKPNWSTTTDGIPTIA